VRGAVKALIVASEFLEAQGRTAKGRCVERICSAATTPDDSRPIRMSAMGNEDKPDRSNVHYIEPHKQPKRLVSRTRLVMGLLLIIAVPIFSGLANKLVLENSKAIQQVLGR
jgi:hypothetical protein